MGGERREIIAAILTTGVLNRVSFDGKLTLGRDDAVGEAVALYGKILNKLKEQQSENDALDEFESDEPHQ